MKNLAMAVGVALGVAAILFAVFLFNMLDITSRQPILVGQNVNLHDAKVDGSKVDPTMHLSEKPAVTSPPELAESDLALRMEHARDYRVLFESILGSKSEKAGLYAMQILRICANSRYDPITTPSSSIQQDRARDLWVARCATFTDEELSDSRRLGLVSDPRLQGGLTDLLRAWYSAGLDNKKRQSSLAAVFQSRDPLLMASVGSTVMYKPETKNFSFNGVQYKEEMGPLLLNIFYAASCEAAGALCGPDDAYVVEACARTGYCASTRLELITQQNNLHYGDEGSSIFKTIYPQMVTAIRNNDASAFVK